MLMYISFDIVMSGHQTASEFLLVYTEITDSHAGKPFFSQDPCKWNPLRVDKT